MIGSREKTSGEPHSHDGDVKEQRAMVLMMLMIAARLMK